MDGLDKFIDKISSYQLFNYFFPGILFVTCVENITSIRFLPEKMFQQVFVFYFVGMILSRLGSILIEKWFRLWKIVKHSKYAQYLEAVKKDEKIFILVQENNMYRTIVSGTIVLLVVYILDQFNWFCAFNNMIISKIVYLILVILIFTMSYRKQTSFIKSRVEKAIDKQNNDQETMRNNTQIYNK